VTANPLPLPEAETETFGTGNRVWAEACCETETFTAIMATNKPVRSKAIIRFAVIFLCNRVHPPV